MSRKDLFAQALVHFQTTWVGNQFLVAPYRRSSLSITNMNLNHGLNQGHHLHHHYIFTRKSNFVARHQILMEQGEVRPYYSNFVQESVLIKFSSLCPPWAGLCPFQYASEINGIRNLLLSIKNSLAFAIIIHYFSFNIKICHETNQFLLLFGKRC